MRARETAYSRLPAVPPRGPLVEPREALHAGRVPRSMAWFFAGALCLAEAHSQMIGWDIAMPGLDRTDIEMMQQVARVEMDGKSPGTVLDWSNPASGASGTVTLLRRGTLNGMECRDLRHAFTVPTQAPWELDSRICRQEDGSWKIMEQRRRSPGAESSETN